MSERWCNPGHVHMKEHLSSLDIELLTVGMRPYYLPREFTSAIIISVYVPPSADAAVACVVIHSAVAQIQTQHPDAFIVITGVLIMFHWTKPSQHFTSMFGAAESCSCPDAQLCTAANGVQQKSEINHLKQGSLKFVLHQFKCTLYR